MSASKKKGTAAESAVVAYLRGQGWPHAERRALHGSGDRGDIAGVVGTVIEVKNCAKTELAGWVEEVRREAATDGAAFGVVWHKRRGKALPGDWFVTMDGATFARLLRKAQGLDEQAGGSPRCAECGGDLVKYGDDAPWSHLGTPEPDHLAVPIGGAK